MKKVSFTVAGQKIVGTLQFPEQIKEKNPAILIIHGWNSAQIRNFFLAEKLIKLGFICMTFDLRSHGESKGDRQTLSREDYLKDVTAAYDFLKDQKGVDSENIGVVGSSFGSYLGIILTSIRKVAFLLLRVPANYFDEGFNDPQIHFAAGKSLEWRKKELSFDGTRSLRALHDFSNEIVIIESELDELVPQQTINNYINAVVDKSKLTHVVMLGADHSIKDDASREEFAQILIHWFKAKE